MKKNYSNIIIERNGSVDTLWLNRPEVHNALNLEIMNEVIDYFKQIETDELVRVVVLRGKGKSLCAGADLNWMKQSAELSAEDNLEECKLLSLFFDAIYSSSKITIALAVGSIYGGGNGLAAACDMAYGLNQTKFCLSETRLGIVAATITPFMLKKLKPSVYKELIFTARVFNGVEALKVGLLNHSFDTMEQMDKHLNSVLNAILNGGPESLVGTKKLIHKLIEVETRIDALANIPKVLADVRTSEEAKEGFKAFVEKRKPKWI